MKIVKASKKSNKKSDKKDDSWHIYKVSVLERVAVFIGAVIIGVGLGWLFYEHWIGMIIGIFIMLILKKNYYNVRSVRLKKKVSEEFIVINNMLLGELYGGVSAERAISNIYRAVCQDISLDVVLMRGELKSWVNSIEIGHKLDDLLEEFAKKTENQAIIQFANVFRMSRAQGANLLSVIEMTNRVLRENAQMRREIDVLIAEKKFEQQIMSIMPFVLLFCLRNLSAEFVDPLYSTAIGRVAMTILLCIFTGCYFWSYKMTVIL